MTTPPEWQAIAARMASCAVDPHGAPRILTLRVLVDPQGTPVLWARPEVTVLEPKATALAAFLALVGEEVGDGDGATGG